MNNQQNVVWESLLDAEMNCSKAESFDEVREVEEGAQP
jgi:hypothetical protein